MIPVALFGAVFSGWATWGLGLEAIGYGAALLAGGLPIYWAVRRG
jgi:APA family basic amino acid/polyamine antiporter